MTATVWLKKDREKSLLRHHPWVFSGAIARVEGKVAPGEPVELRSARGDFLGRGAFSPSSQITVRVWTFEEDEEVGPQMFRRRLEHALALRRPLEGKSSALRLVNAESDGLPGVV
ncbi:MAG: 23S rRNA (cytosine(1962)-C(5))-methyltransferase RlmI, partial [Deltaproteobacteria bacterium]|nr:23S rRNA (cytosine(1962)-C(5))-methyltransferase RlmI [Deltaproteobacteria bacterium]